MKERFKRYLAKYPRLKPAVYFAWTLMRRWGEDECPVKAAAMAFFGLLSIFPIILAAVSILATIMAGNLEVLHSFGEFIAQFFPGQAGTNISEAVKMAVRRIASKPNATSLGIVAVLSLLWSGRAYFLTLANVLNHIWPEAEPRTFLQKQVALWGTFVAAGALGLLSMSTTWILSGVQLILSSLPLWFLDRLPLLSVLTHILSWGFAFLMFWLMYSFLPNVGPNQRKLSIGAALFATIAWEIAKYAFTYAVGRLVHYEATYGGVAGVVVTLIWIYFASMIILLGAESAASWDNVCKRLSREKHRMPVYAASRAAGIAQRRIRK